MADKQRVGRDYIIMSDIVEKKHKETVKRTAKMVLSWLYK